MEGGTGQYAFPPYMPEDARLVQDDTSTESLTVARSELSRLLQEGARDFWQVVTDSPSLSSSLDSYLQYARSVPLHWCFGAEYQDPAELLFALCRCA